MSLAADGVDLSLDKHLSELRNYLRGKVSTDELESQLIEIEESVRKLDEKKQQSFSDLAAGYQKLGDTLKLKKLSRKTKSKIKTVDRTVQNAVENRNAQIQLINDYSDVLDDVLQQLLEDGEGGGGSFWQRLMPGSNANINSNAAEEDSQQLSTELAEDDTDGLELDAGSSANQNFEEQIAKERVIGIILALLDQINVPEVLTIREQKIRSLLKKGISWDELPETLSEAISLVTGGRIAAQREFETFLFALNTGNSSFSC